MIFINLNGGFHNCHISDLARYIVYSLQSNIEHINVYFAGTQLCQNNFSRFGIAGRLYTGSQMYMSISNNVGESKAMSW